MMGAKNLVPAKYPRSLENCLCYPQNTLRVVATRVLRVRGSKSGSFIMKPQTPTQKPRFLTFPPRVILDIYPKSPLT